MAIAIQSLNEPKEITKAESLLKQEGLVWT
jgi:hypothetical protein